MSAQEASDPVSRVLALEADLGLLQRTIAGIYYWRLFRLDLARDPSVSALQAGQRKGALAKVLDAMRTDVAAMGALLRPSASHAGSIVLPFPRKALQGGRVADRFSEPILAESRLGPFLVLENPASSRWLSSGQAVQVEDQERALTATLLRAVLGIPGLLPQARREHALIDAAHQRRFGAPVRLTPQGMAWRVSFFRERVRVLQRRFAKSGATWLFSTLADPAVFAAANALGLKTVQIQHGAFGPHLGLHFPGRPAVAYSPQQLWVWGDYWARRAELPGNCRAVVTGSTTIRAVKSTPTVKTPRSVLALSQMPTDWRLLDTVIEAARKAPDWTFTFRPHPGEDFAAYEARLVAGAAANLRLSPAAEDVYGLLASTEVQVGVCSTTLFEGMALGARTIILDLPGRALMAEVVRSGDAAQASSADEIASLLASAPLARNGDDYFAPPLDAEALWALCRD